MDKYLLQGLNYRNADESESFFFLSFFFFFFWGGGGGVGEGEGGMVRMNILRGF